VHDDIDPDVAARIGGDPASEIVEIAREALSNVARAWRGPRSVG
jgi:hypothetical protein